MTPDEFGDPATRSVTTRVNGVDGSVAPLDDMLFDVSSVITIFPRAMSYAPAT